MKQIKILIAAFLLVLAGSSCKKENTMIPAGATHSLKVSKIGEVGTTWVTEFAYNSAGRLTQVRDNSFTLTYDYSADIPVITTYKTATGVKTNQMVQAALAGNRITTLNIHYFNAQGQETYVDASQFQYDQNGFQTKKSYGSYEYSTEVNNGNMTKLTARNSGSGAVTHTITYEFYSDKQDKFNLNIFEQGWYDNVINDRALMGTKNTNLIKKITYQSATYTQVSQFTYITNTDGYVTEYTLGISVNGATPSTSTYKVTYQ